MVDVYLTQTKFPTYQTICSQYTILYSRVGQILTFFKIQESGIYDWIRVEILRTK